MAEKNSTIRGDFSQLQRARFSARHSARTRPGSRIPDVAASPPNPAVSPSSAPGPGGNTRLAATAPSPAPRARTQVAVSTAKKSQPTAKTAGKRELIGQLKSPDWLVNNARREFISVELKNAMTSLIAVCSMLEKISHRLDNPIFGNPRERRHVEVFSDRLLRSWAALSLVLECYNDDPGWARSTVSRTAFELEELFLDLHAMLARARKALDFMDRSRDSDDSMALPEFWLTRDAYDRYRALEDDVIAVAKAARQLNDEIACLPDKGRAPVRLGDILFNSSSPGARRKPGPSADKPFFQAKHLPELTSLERQASSIQACLCDLGTRLASAHPQQQLVASMLKDAATELQATVQSAKNLKAWETGLHRSRHLFLKAHAKLQDMASAVPNAQTRELGIQQKIAASIYASFDSVINIVLDLPSDGVTDGGNRSRRKAQSRNVSIISSPMSVTRRHIPAGPAQITPALPVGGSATQSDDVQKKALEKGATGHPSAARRVEQKTVARPRDTGKPGSSVSLSPRKTSNAVQRSQQMSVS